MTAGGRVVRVVMGRGVPTWVRRPGLRWRLSAAAFLVRTSLLSLALDGLFVTIAASVVLHTAGLAGVPATALAVAAAVVLPLWRHTSRLARTQFRIIGRIGTLHTARLIVRPVRADDADALAEVMDTTMLAANGWTDDVKAAALRLVRRLGSNISGEFAITRGVGTDAIGTIGVSNVVWTSRSCDMSWSVRADCRGRGYATEAAGAVLDALHALGLDTVHIGMRTSNVAARRVAAKLGATFVARRPHTLPDGEVADSAWYDHLAATA
jgi:RimJ/RimL family protein N-acetyltransferase